MAVTNGAPQPGAADWDEAQCTSALAQLELLQEQINGLRRAIPRIIEPFHSPTTPTTFKVYAHSLFSSQNNIKSLHDQWKQPRMQATFEHVKESYGTNPDLSKAILTPQYGWVERDKKARGAKKTAGDDTEVVCASLTEDDVSRIVADFQKTYPNMKFDTLNNNSSIFTRFISGSMKLQFSINIEREVNGRHKLVAECQGTAEPFLTISKCISSRPKPHDLKYLLDMIVAYKTVKGLLCAKCGQLLDNSMLNPLARRSRITASAVEAPEVVWEAFHENCL
ncbi:hypothetical protein ACN47E_006370 [Coniothyrium glycines]